METNYCVYVHINKSNGKKYYGITNNISARWGLNGKRYVGSSCRAFGAAIEKYGWDGFEHIVLHEGISKEEACERERFYIASDKTNICRYGNEYGYNMTDGGEGVCGGYDKHGENNPFYNKSHSAKTRQDISDALCGTRSGSDNHNYDKPICDETRKKISRSVTDWFASSECPTHKKVYCVTDELWFDSVSDAAKFYDISIGLISGCCTGNAMSTHGKQFTYNLDGSLPEYRGSYSATRKNNKLKRGCCNATPVMCVETGAIFDSLADAARYANVKHTNNIRESCKDARRVSGGYHWRYI